MRNGVLLLKPGIERKLGTFYPWIYRHEVEAVEGETAPGDVIEVRSARGEFVCLAFFNPTSHIPGRVLTLDRDERIDREFIARRLDAALRRRAARVQNTNAVRLVHAEADQLPGLIIDRFADVLVLQLRNHGMDRLRDEIVRACKRAISPRGIYERSDSQARLEEGLEARNELLSGEVPRPLEVQEDELVFRVDVQAGQKTGFYLDQRDNRRALEQLVGPAARLLDVYGYTGGFSLHAARGGAQALAIDKDAAALTLLEENARMNGLEQRVGARWGDAVEVMEDLAREGRRFTHIVLDPPTLAKHKNDVPRVKELLVEIAARALAVLEPDGLLLLSTCAYHLSPGDLLESARRAANDAHRRAEILKITYQPADHPWILQVPETLYLKTIFLRASG